MPTPEPSAFPTPNSELPTQNTLHSAFCTPHSERRRRGKVARLPKALRDRINQLLLDGATYAQVVENVAAEAPDLNEDHLYSWAQGGYQDWLRQQQWLEGMRNQLDFALDVIHQEEGAALHQANLHVAATQLIQSLTDCGPTLIEQNPGAYTHLVNSITKLGREALNFQKYREACAQARSTLQQLRDPKRDLTEEERQAIVDKLDEILGFK